MTQIQATLIDHMGSDLSTVNAARVSFGKTSQWEFSEDPDDTGTLSERDTKLIRYLAKHNHLSPFGHAFASFHVKAPLFVHAQLVKHKFLRVNTISRRYVDDSVVLYTPDTWRGRSEDKKQGSSDDMDWEHTPYCYETSLNNYKFLLDTGVAPEMARMVLPQALMTEFYWSGSLDAFAAMCVLRCAPDTQYESRVVADQISEVMGRLFPVSWEALMKGQTND